MTIDLMLPLLRTLYASRRAGGPAATLAGRELVRAEAHCMRGLQQDASGSDAADAPGSHGRNWRRANDLAPPQWVEAMVFDHPGLAAAPAFSERNGVRSAWPSWRGSPARLGLGLQLEGTNRCLAAGRRGRVAAGSRGSSQRLRVAIAS